MNDFVPENITSKTNHLVPLPRAPSAPFRSKSYNHIIIFIEIKSEIKLNIKPHY